MKKRSQNSYKSVPVAFIRRIVPQIIKYGKAIQPGLGIWFLSEEQKAYVLGDAEGVVVREVPPGSPAAKAGLKGLRRVASGQLVLGDTVDVVVARGSKKTALSVKLINVY